MANLKKLKKQIEDVNALGVHNLSKKGVEIPENSTTFEIMKGIGQISSGGASLNVAYGETAPEDTSKLWIKANEPDNFQIKNGFGELNSVNIITEMLPTALAGCMVEKVETDIFILGGHSPNGLVNTIYKFDTLTETFTKMSATIPTTLAYAGSSVLDGKIYLFGGQTTGDSSSRVGTIYCYDTKNDELIPKTVTIPPASGCSAIAVNEKIYIIGGSVSSTSSSKYIYEYDTTHNEITTKNATTETYGVGSSPLVSRGTDIYCFGGVYYANSSTTQYVKAIVKYDTVNDTIESVASLVSAKSSSCAFVCGTNVYVCGGDNYGNPLATIEKYSFKDNSVEVLSTEIPYTNYLIEESGAIVGNKGYIFGGFDNNSIKNSIVKIEFENLQNGKGLIINSNANTFNLLPNVEIGVENVYIGNENNEAELCEAYLHNATEWVRI